MKSEKALANLKKSIYAPIILAIIFLILDFMGQTTESFPDFNRLFSIMTPLETIGGLFLVFGLTTVGTFHLYLKTLKQ